MSYLDDLERLNTLRERGGLSENEFEQKKLALLQSEPESLEQNYVSAKPRIGRYIGIAFGVLVIAAVAYESVPIRSGNTSSAAVIDANSMEGVDAVTESSVQATTPAMPFDRYAWATDVERLGQSASMVEEKLGPPEDKNKSSFSYNLNGCVVAYTTKRAKVSSVYMAVSDTCHPVMMGESVTQSMDFKSVDSLGNGTIVTNCLEQCGNAADPATTFWTQGPHSELFLNRVYGTSSGDAVAKAREAWGVIYRRQRGLVDNAEVNDQAISSCQSTDDDTVRNAIGPALINSVTIGYSLPKC